MIVNSVELAAGQVWKTKSGRIVLLVQNADKLPEESIGFVWYDAIDDDLNFTLVKNQLQEFLGTIEQNSFEQYAIKGSMKHGVRRFTASDWTGFAGAEKFPDGSDPFILDDLSEDFVIIGGYNSIEMIKIDEAGEMQSYIMDGVEKITPAVAAMILNNLPADLLNRMEEFGFQEI